MKKTSNFISLLGQHLPCEVGLESQIRWPLGTLPRAYSRWGHAALLLEPGVQAGLLIQCSSKWEEKNWHLRLQQLVFIFYKISRCSDGNCMGP